VLTQHGAHGSDSCAAESLQSRQWRLGARRGSSGVCSARPPRPILPPGPAASSAIGYRGRDNNQSARATRDEKGSSHNGARRDAAFVDKGRRTGSITDGLLIAVYPALHTRLNDQGVPFFKNIIHNEANFEPPFLPRFWVNSGDEWFRSASGRRRRLAGRVDVGVQMQRDVRAHACCRRHNEPFCVLASISVYAIATAMTARAAAGRDAAACFGRSAAVASVRALVEQ
jgi:hypothetical protein